MNRLQISFLMRVHGLTEAQRAPDTVRDVLALEAEFRAALVAKLEGAQ